MKRQHRGIARRANNPMPSPTDRCEGSSRETAVEPLCCIAISNAGLPCILAYRGDARMNEHSRMRGPYRRPDGHVLEHWPEAARSLGPPRQSHAGSRPWPNAIRLETACLLPPMVHRRDGDSSQLADGRGRAEGNASGLPSRRVPARGRRHSRAPLLGWNTGSQGRVDGRGAAGEEGGERAQDQCQRTVERGL